MKKKASLFLFLFPLFLFGQESDFKLWSKLSLDYSLSKKSKLSFTQGSRWRENASLKDELHSNLSYDQKMNKNLRLGAAYRFILEYDIFFNRFLSHRINIDARYRKKWNRLSFVNRARVQFSDKFVLRDRLSIHYNIRKTPLSPYTAFEIYNNLNSFNRFRATLGANYPVFKDLSLDIYYRVQQDIDKSRTSYILGLGLNYDM